MPIGAVLGLLVFELVVLAGGLWWTFRRAQMPVGVAGALGLAAVIALSQALLMAVVQAGLDVGAGRALLGGDDDNAVHLWSVAAGLLAVWVAAPMALKRYLRLDARWTRALSRELLAGSITSTFATLAAGGLLMVLVLLGAMALDSLR